MRTTLPLILALVSCTSALPEQSPPPPGFTLSSSPWIAGERATITATGLPPNTTAQLGIGAGGLGDGPCPPALQGLCLDIDAPLFLLPSSRSDATGTATWRVPVPAPRPGLSGALQSAAFIRGAATLSNPVPVWIHEAGTILSPGVDLDGDGFTPATGDCYEGDDTVNVDAPDVVGDGLDTNCDGVDGHADLDGDGVGGDLDCDDADPSIFPGAQEVCDGIDQDCSGDADDGIPNDGHGCQDPGAPVLGATASIYTVTVRTDTITNAGTNTNQVQTCIDASTCLPLAMENWNDLESGAIEVHAVEGLSYDVSRMDRVEFRSTNGPDAWRPACVSVALDGQLMACSLPVVWIGTDPTDTTIWTDSVLDLECGGCYPDALTHGPTLGAADPTSARIWWRTEYTRRTVLRVGPLGSDPAAGDVVAIRYPSAEHDFATEVQVQGLQPDTRYVFSVEVDGTIEATGELKTPPTASSQFSFGFGSCAREEDQSTFGLIDAMSPELMFMIGDNHYGNTGEVDALRQFYRWSRERPARGLLGQHTPMIATWDDHDYTGNNTDGTEPGRDNASRVFQEYWANRPRPDGDQAIYSSYSYGDVDFFLVDVRYHRGLDGTFLGQTQFDWLIDSLRNSDATFKIVASGSQWTYEGSSDSWSNYPDDLDDFFGTLADDGIEGVVLLSGDVHRSEFRALGGKAGGYTVPELTSSPMANSNSTCTPSNEMSACHNVGNSFVMVDVDTTAADPTLTAHMHDESGAELYRWTVLRSDLQPQVLVPADPSQDITGDGLADLVLGVPGQSAAAGAIAVFRGTTAGPEAGQDQLITQDSGDIGGGTEDNDGFGSVLATGDVDGDGFADVISGTPNEAIGTLAASGYIHVMFGTAGGVSVTGDQAFTENGLGSAPAAGDELGAAIATGDMDADGFDDVVIGIPGADEIVVLFGSPAGFDLAAVQRFTAADFGLTAGSRFGAALAVGDFNGDGRADFAVGAPESTAGGDAEAGSVGIAMAGAGRSFALTEIDQASPNVPGSPEVGDHFGATLATGDLNGDGFSDLAIGCPEEDIDTNADSGMVIAFGGSASGLNYANNASAHMNTITLNLGAGDRLGAALAIGDLDGDGRDELAMGAPNRTIGGAANTGKVVVVEGANLVDLSRAVSVFQDDIIDSAGGAEHLFGWALSMADYDGDGRADLTIGAPGTAINGRASAGMAAIVFGGADWRGTMRTQRWHQDLDGVETATGTNERFGASLP